MERASTDKPGVIAPPPLIYLATFLISLLLQRIRPLPLLPSPLRNILGTSLLGAAAMIVFLSFREMGKAGTNVNPELPATSLVTQGPFQFTRNPIYLSLTLLYTGLATLINTLWAILLLPVMIFIMQHGVIEREERYLEEKFGDGYTQYKARVRRWL